MTKWDRSRAIVDRLTVQWGDCDPAGIVFYPRFFEWMDRASHLLEREMGVTREEMLPPGTTGFPLLAARAEFLAPATMGDRIEVRAHVARVGRTSLALSLEIVRVEPEPEMVLARGYEDRVYTERGPGTEIRPRPLTDAMRELLSRFMLPGQTG